MSLATARDPARSQRSYAARSALVEHLMRHAAGLTNDALFASLLAGWALGRGCLPADLGLGPAGFERCLRAHFPGLCWASPSLDDAAGAERRTRALELDDLIALLESFADREVHGAVDMARVVAFGCLGGDHLWQDLGLESRAELRALMERNFPRLAALNDRDMKWKKFLYRRLCELEGLLLCRSPTCEACCEYSACFGPEG